MKKRVSLQCRNPNQAAPPVRTPVQIRVKSTSSACSYVLNGGKRGDLGTEEVRRVTRVQLLHHGSANEPLMCFELGSLLCSQQDQRYSLLLTVGSPVMAASGCRASAVPLVLVSPHRSKLHTARVSWRQVWPFPSTSFLISVAGNGSRRFCGGRTYAQIFVHD